MSKCSSSLTDLSSLSTYIDESSIEVIFCDTSFTPAGIIQIKVENKANISLRGLEENGTTIHCMEEMGLSFINVTDLTITDMTFIACGDIFHSTSLNITTNTSTLNFLANIYIYNCTNVNIERISVLNSTGTGIAMFNTDGYVQVINSTFCNNSGDSSGPPGGGGVYVEFTYCPPGNIDNCTSIYRKNQNSSYLFQNCTFTSNNGTAVEVERTSYYKAEGTNYHGLGRGGGLCVIFKGNATNNEVIIDECKFTHNGAIWGAGLYVAFHDSPQKNTISVDNTLFSHNDCYLNGGGGVDIGLLFYKDLPPKENTMKFNNCRFIENRAKYGGGIKFYSSQSKSDLKNNIEFNDCTWKRNNAQYGSAVDISPQVWDTLAEGYLPTPTFSNCSFTHNYIHDVEVTDNDVFTFHNTGKGTFLSTGFSINFKGMTTFHGNSGTAMYLSSSSIHFHENSVVNFTENTGFEGGAVTLLGFSVLYVNDHSKLDFVNNSAYSFGGAISYTSNNKHDFSSSRSCFIQYAGTTESVPNRSIMFTFSGNKAGNGNDSAYGQTIFTTTLRPCRRGCPNVTKHEFCDNNDTAYSTGFICIGNFTFSDNRLNDVSTSGANFIWTNSDSPLTVSPGQELNISFKLLDDLCQEAFGVYHVQTNDRFNRVTLDSASTYTSDKIVRLFGNPGASTTLQLATTGFREISLHIKVVIQHCQPGYVVIESNKGNKCVCSTHNESTHYYGIERCDEFTNQAFIGRKYWVGYRDIATEEALISGYCPHAFCHARKEISRIEYPLPKQPSKGDLDDTICSPYRTGKLCGRCQEGYSTYFHNVNYKCRSSRFCKWGWLFYTLSELVPVTILFLFVIFLHIQFTSGAINGFILFVQLIDTMATDANGQISSKPGNLLFIKAYRFIYRMFNLEFFTLDELSFCIWKGATTMDVLAVKYATIVYSLLLIAITIVVMKLCTVRCSKLSIKGSIIHGFSAFFVICYAQCTRVTLLLLRPTQLYAMGLKKVEKVVYYQGDFIFMSGEHLRYAIPALFFMTTLVAVPLILLLVYPFCYKVFAILKIEETKLVRIMCRVVPLEKMKPLFDSFQSCFKDDYRFMAGVYFLYRLVVYTTSVVADSYTKFYVLLEIEFILMLTIQATTYAYKKHWHNTVDILLFTNLAVINAMTIFNYKRATEINKDQLYQREIDIVRGIQTFLIYLPLAYLVCYIITQLRLQIFHGKAERKEESSQHDDDTDYTDTLTAVDYRELSSLANETDITNSY